MRRDFERAQAAWENQLPDDDACECEAATRLEDMRAALDNIADLLKDVTATEFTDLHRDQILEWADVR